MLSRAVKRYTLTHSATSNRIKAEQVWAIWKDVNNWTKWDKGLESCQLTAEFAKGQSFLLKPIGAPMNLTTTLLEVEVNKKFKDRTEMPLGIIEVSHEIYDRNDGLQITHTIEADIFEDKVTAFENTLWQKWQKGLPNSVQNIIDIIEENQKNCESSPGITI